MDKRVLAIAGALLAGGLFSSSGALADWQTQRYDGGEGAAASLRMGKYNLSLSCSRSQRPSLQFTLVGKSFPNLHASDDVEASLAFRFVLEGGASYTERFSAWYYGGDGAWTGQIAVGEAFLVAFEKAGEMQLLNPKGGVVLTFPMRGSGKAGKAFRQDCRLGD